MKLFAAEKIARKIVEELRPFAERIEIAGSIRRGCGEVNDIDLVIVPRDQAALRSRVLWRSTAIQDGPQNLLTRLANGFQLDIFFAHGGKRDLLDSVPSNWGSVLLCRTGPKEFNIKLCQAAAALGLKWETYNGVTMEGGYVLASATEEEIFAALQMEYVKPEDRR